jgi:hypothetical protein
MIVYVYPADVYGCGFYRLIGPARVLRAQGHDVRVQMPSDRRGIGGEFDSKTGRLVSVQIPPDADVIVMQRVSLQNLVEAIPMIQARGVAVVVDMDDDLTKIDPGNPAFAALHPKMGRDARHTWSNAEAACRVATLVTVSTPALLGVYARHGRGVVLPNRVPAAYLDVEHVDSPVIGWAGSTHSHPNDLHEVGPAIARLVREGHRYRGVGPVNGLRQALGLEEDPDCTGDVTLADWPLRVAEIGVGIAPLADIGFNRSKSGLKVLEMMACGVPWVASPRIEYKALHDRYKIGLLADKPKDWYKMIKRLAESEQMRRDMSVSGRAVAAALTIERNAWRWLEVWNDAIEVVRGGARTPFTRT